jgi:hypothetical protein
MKDSVAITVWSVLPLTAACVTVIHENAWAALLFAIIAIVALTAAFLSRSAKAARPGLAVVLLLLISIPFAILIVDRLTTGYTSHPWRVGDSPTGFIVGAVFESLFAVPPAVFAFGIWRRMRR